MPQSQIEASHKSCRHKAPLRCGIVATTHDDFIKWKYLPRYWPFVRGIHRSPLNYPHKGQWRGALMFFICARINAWVNKREAGDLRHYGAHYDVTVMIKVMFGYQKALLTHWTYFSTKLFGSYLQSSWEGVAQRKLPELFYATSGKTVAETVNYSYKTRS